MSHERQEILEHSFTEVSPDDYLKPGADLKSLPDRFKVYAPSLKKWLFFERTPQPAGNWKKVPREQLRDFPPNSGTYDLSDPSNPVAVIVPCQNYNIQRHAIHSGAGMTGPCLTPRGVELVIANTVYNRNLRWMIIAGSDSGHMTGDIFDCLYRYGIDGDGRVINTRCPTFPYLRNLPGDVIESFRRQVEVVNLVGCDDLPVLAMVIRLCLQEPDNAFTLRLDRAAHVLYDKGALDEEQMLCDFSVLKLGGVYDNYGAFAGTAIHASTVSEAFGQMLGHVMHAGSWGRQESSRMALDCVNVSITMRDVVHDKLPAGYRPQSWLNSDGDALDYLEKYSTWVYLFPLTEVKYDPATGRTAPSLATQLDYSYGTRLTCYGYETCRDAAEKERIRDLVLRYHGKFREKSPGFADVADFHAELKEVQGETFNSLAALADGCCTAVRDGMGNSYRMYTTLQIPSIDLAKPSPYEMHNPCFCVYQPNPRHIGYSTTADGGREARTFQPSMQPGHATKAGQRRGWFLFPLMMLRAHDAMAFPSNAWGGIKLSDYIAWRISTETGQGVEIGEYTQFASSLHIVDYAMDKNVLKALNGDAGGTGGRQI